MNTDPTRWQSYLASAEGRRRALHMEANWHRIRIQDIERALAQMDTERERRRQEARADR